MPMKDKPYLILSISGDKDYVCDAYDHIRSTYDIDKKHVTKRTIDSMLLEYMEGDRAYCYIPIFPSTKKLVRERVRYIMARWDVNGIYCNANLKDIFPEILEK